MWLNLTWNKISSFTNLAINAALDAKITNVKSKISDITNLPTTTAFLLLKIKYVTLVT